MTVADTDNSGRVLLSVGGADLQEPALPSQKVLS